MRLFLLSLLLLPLPLLAQPSERINHIRTLYANAQRLVRDQRDNAAISWNLKTILHHNEPGVGVVTYEIDYYPLNLLQATDFVRIKRFWDGMTPTLYEILYDEHGKPAFYFEREDTGTDGIHEYRIYWDAKGKVIQFLPQSIKTGGNKVHLTLDEADQQAYWLRARQLALQEYKRGTEGYATDYRGIGAPAIAVSNSEAELFQQICRVYDAYFSPADYDDGQEYNAPGLGRMAAFVTDAFCEQLSLCIAKAEATDDLFLDYDIWSNSQECDATGISGVTIRDFSPRSATAIVELIIYGNPHQVILQFVYDPLRQTWLITDFINPEDNTSFVKSMKDYLR